MRALIDHPLIADLVIASVRATAAGTLVKLIADPVLLQPGPITNTLENGFTERMNGVPKRIAKAALQRTSKPVKDAP